MLLKYDYHQMFTNAFLYDGNYKTVKKETIIIMNKDFFKQQSKKLLKDYQTRVFNETEELYEYTPRYFPDIDSIILDFDIDEEGQFTLMKAQHIIALLSGFNKWNELINASEPLLELGKLLLTNREGYLLEEWKFYENQNLQNFSDERKLEVFKLVFLNKE